MEILDLPWAAFRKTGDIDAYLLYREIEEKNRWKQLKQEELSQDAPITEKQTQY